MKKSIGGVREFLNNYARNGILDDSVNYPERKVIDIETRKPHRFDPENEENRKLYNLMKRHTMGEEDTFFHLVGNYFTNNAGTFNPVAGVDYQLYGRVIPKDQRIVLTNLVFFTLVDESPVLNYLVMGEPLEFLDLLDFYITLDGKTPEEISYESGVTDPGVAHADIDNVGTALLSKDPTRDLSKDHGGLSIPLVGESRLNVRMRNIDYVYGGTKNGILYRKVVGVGFAMKGFMGPVR